MCLGIHKQEKLQNSSRPSNEIETVACLNHQRLYVLYNLSQVVVYSREHVNIVFILNTSETISFDRVGIIQGIFLYNLHKQKRMVICFSIIHISHIRCITSSCYVGWLFFSLTCLNVIKCIY